MPEILKLFIEHLPELVDGTMITLQVTVIGLGLGLILGLPLSVARVYGGTFFRRVAVGYSEFFRGTPLVVQLFVVYYGLPDLGITLGRLTSAFLALGFNSAAYQMEYFRGAIQSVSGGQMLAARAIGMTHLEAIRYIILPQALKLVIPSWTNEVVGMLRASAVVFLIAVPDVMAVGRRIASRYFDPIRAYIIVAFFYIILVSVFSLLLGWIEQRLRTPGLEVEVARK